ncbi:MAG: tetratricopeptide repeat protein [Candidatus Sericytochromatia bacterium]
MSEPSSPENPLPEVSALVFDGLKPWAGPVDFAAELSFGELGSQDDEMPLPPAAQWERSLNRARGQLAYALETGLPQQLALAIEAYGKLIESNPDQIEPYLVLGYLALEQGSYADAERLLDSAIRLEPFNLHAQQLFHKIKLQASLGPENDC